MKKNRRKILSGSRKIFFAILAMFLSLSASAQQITASGQILDAQKEPLIGVSVQEKGTSNGAITDLDGNFTLNVKQNAILIFSYVGYKSQEVKAAHQMKITLQEDNEVLDEVVVIGYGSVKRKDVTTAISSVSTKDLDMRQSGNLTDKGNGFFLMNTKFTLLFCNIDLDKNRDGYVLFCRLFFDFFCQMKTVHRMDEFCLSNDIFHFVRLQMSDHMPADIFWKNFHFLTHFLNFILSKITRPQIIYCLKHFDWLGFADSDQCHITAFSSCVFACFAYICFYLLQVFL